MEGSYRRKQNKLTKDQQICTRTIVLYVVTNKQRTLWLNLNLNKRLSLDSEDRVGRIKGEREREIKC